MPETGSGVGRASRRGKGPMRAGRGWLAGSASGSVRKKHGGGGAHQYCAERLAEGEVNGLLNTREGARAVPCPINMSDIND
jgi:hypothetical protein